MTDIRVTEPEAWEQVLELAGGFHDGVVKELLLSGVTYVDREGDMCFGHDDEPAEAEFLVQLQGDHPPAVYLRFTGVSWLIYDYWVDNEASVLSAEKGVLEFKFLSCVVRARDCHAQALGPGARGQSPGGWSIRSTS